MAERWTQERRREHTRNLLLDAAEEVFARRGYEGASLEEIAETAGYSRGAIYKHFGSKEELFLEANRRFNERYINNFVGEVPLGLDELNLHDVATVWRDMDPQEPSHFALGAEFNLFVLRNPETHKRVAEERRKTAEMIARFIEEQGKRNGLRTRIPPLTIARLALACSDGIRVEAYIDGDTKGELLEAFLELLVGQWEPVDDVSPEPPPPARKPRTPRKQSPRRS